MQEAKISGIWFEKIEIDQKRSGKGPDCVAHASG